MPAKRVFRNAKKLLNCRILALDISLESERNVPEIVRAFTLKFDLNEEFIKADSHVSVWCVRTDSCL